MATLQNYTKPAITIIVEYAPEPDLLAGSVNVIDVDVVETDGQQNGGWYDGSDFIHQW